MIINPKTTQRNLSMLGTYFFIQVQLNHYKDTCNPKEPKKCEKVALEPRIEDRKFSEKFGEILLEKVTRVTKYLQLYIEE